MKLSLLEENVLRLGLKHHILPKKLDENGFRVQIERLVSNITRSFNVVLNSDFKEKLRSICRSYIAQANGLCSSKQNQAFHRTLQALSRNKEIKICKYDKGNGVVVLDNDDYFNKLDKIVLDKEKFEEIRVDSNKVHPIISNEDSIKRYLYNHVKNNVEETVYNNILPSGSQPGKLYGLCKVHKAGYPMRPVISMVGTAEYKLAKFLDTFIKPNINVDFTVDSTGAFVKKLEDFQFKRGDYSVSFDVSSLFTNVPLDETIQLIAEKVYSVESKIIPSFPKKVFIKLMKFATGGMFLYNDKIFKQVDGVAMGSPLGPSLANFFLGHLEANNFFTNSGINPKLYVRYVDDIFAVFEKDVQFQPFLEQINSQHPNIKFTIEESVDNVLAFLDTEIRIIGDEFESCVYRKSTNTDVLLNFGAVCPAVWKKGIILGSLNRAKLICSSLELFRREVDKLRLMFLKNGYSRYFFDKVLGSFENRRSKDENYRKEKKDIDFNLMIKIPFVGSISYEFKSRLSNLFFKDLNIEIFPIFTTTKLSNSFSLKSRTPKEITTNVVYKFTCVCDASLAYIGKTKRHLGVRSDEHLRYEKEQPRGEIKTHLRLCEMCKKSTIDNFEIVKKCLTDQEAKINEALIIKKENPQLNKNLFNKGSLFTLNIYY